MARSPAFAYQPAAATAVLFLAKNNRFCVAMFRIVALKTCALLPQQKSNAETAVEAAAKN
jgi:hypothetical protein